MNTTIAFATSGNTAAIAYTSTEPGSATVASAQTLLVTNDSATDVISIAWDYTGDVVADLAGTGTVIGPLSTIALRVTTQYTNAPLYLSVAGSATSGTVYVTTGGL